MGVYRYRINKRNIPSEIGAIHTTSYIDKPSFFGAETSEAKARVNRANRDFDKAPDFFTLGNPRDRDFLALAKKSAKPLSFGVYGNPKGKVVFEDSLLGYDDIFPVVGSIVLNPDGTMDFVRSEEIENHFSM